MGVRNPDLPKDSVKPRGKKPAPRELGCTLSMGKGAKRVVRKGQVALGVDELHFHTGRTGRSGADFSLHIPYGDIGEIEVDVPDGTLTMEVVEHGPIVLQLGKHASDWKKMIVERDTPLDQLGVGKNSKKLRVGLVGIDDDELQRELATRVPAFAEADAGELDLLFVGVEHKADLLQLGPLSKRVKRGGVLWAVVSTRARSAPEAHEIAAAGRGAGLVSGNVVDFSRTLQALRLAKV
jgi:hypothetical protein